MHANLKPNTDQPTDHRLTDHRRCWHADQAPLACILLPIVTNSLNFIVYNDSIEHRFVYIVVRLSRFWFWRHDICFIYSTLILAEKTDFQKCIAISAYFGC